MSTIFKLTSDVVETVLMICSASSNNCCCVKSIGFKLVLLDEFDFPIKLPSSSTLSAITLNMKNFFFYVFTFAYTQTMSYKSPTNSMIHDVLENNFSIFLFFFLVIERWKWTKWPIGCEQNGNKTGQKKNHTRYLNIYHWRFQTNALWIRFFNSKPETFITITYPGLWCAYFTGYSIFLSWSILSNEISSNPAAF